MRESTILNLLASGKKPNELREKYKISDALLKRLHAKYLRQKPLNIAKERIRRMQRSADLVLQRQKAKAAEQAKADAKLKVRALKKRKCGDGCGGTVIGIYRASGEWKDRRYLPGMHALRYYWQKRKRLKKR